MNLYPAMKATMGRWNYFIVKMTMRELADNVKFAAELYEDQTLNEAIQRVLNTGRVKTDIVTYLVRQPDRFFASIVIAALGGEPQWYPVHIDNDDRFALVAGDARLNNAFGVLSFDGTQDYYALDGQHRLSAIKALVDHNSDAYQDAPAEFGLEEISVLVVVPEEAEDPSEFMERYRRLFGNLNRYAKPMDQVTNIIMDEDDAFAIITRRLISEHPFFTSPGRQKESTRIKTKKGKNLKTGDPYLTSLEAFYAMNIALLETTERRDAGWNTSGADTKEYRRYRPDDDELDALYDELVLYWDGIIDSVPQLREEPSRMRNHAALGDDDDDDDVALFWPIGQELLAGLCRGLLNARQDDPSAPTKESVAGALEGVGQLEWDFHTPPWRHLVLIPDADDLTKWKVRSEDRKTAQGLALRILRWQIGNDPLEADEIAELRRDWESMLLPALSKSQMDGLWTTIENGVQR